MDKRTKQALMSVTEGRKMPAGVYVPPALRGKQPTVVYETRSAAPVSVEENLVRIQEEADPLGLLIAIANGMPIPNWVVGENGELSVEYTSAGLSERRQVAQRLAGMLIDNAVDKPKKGKTIEVAPDAEWNSLVKNAAGFRPLEEQSGGSGEGLVQGDARGLPGSDTE